MRTISQSLFKAQRAQSPAGRVQVAFEDVGFWSEDSADWSLLTTIGVGDNGLTAEPHAAVALSSGAIVVAYNRSDVTKIYARRVADPTSAASWATTPVQVASGALVGISASGDDMVVMANGNEVRILYPVNSDMYQAKSTDGGVTWGAGALVYSPAGDGFGNAVGFYHASLGWVVFHRPDGIEMVRSASGTTWTATAQYASILWNPIGVDTYDAASQTIRLFLKGGEGNRVVFGQITYSFATNTYSNLKYIDHAGNQFGPAPQRLFVGRGLNGLLLIGLEGTSNGQQYPVLGHVHATLPLVDEPVMYVNGFLFEAARRMIPVMAGGITYLVGRKYIYAASRKLGVGTIGTGWISPVVYRYERDGSAGGDIEIELPSNIGAPRLGCLMRVRRGLYVDGGGGEADVLAMVIYVEWQRERLIVQAVDGLGMLGHYRGRRSFPMVATYYNWVTAIQATVARAGVLATISDGGALAAATDYKDFVLNANENILSFLYRLLRNKITLYRVNGATMGVEFIATPTNTPYEYGEGGHPLNDWATVQDARTAGLAVFGGRASASELIDQGEAWGAADGARFAGVRPVPTVYIDRRLVATDLASAADGEGSRQRLMNVDVQIVAAANLALEVYDRVALTVVERGWRQQVFRVNGITETFENGLLIQEISLGDDT